MPLAGNGARQMNAALFPFLISFRRPTRGAPFRRKLEYAESGCWRTFSISEPENHAKQGAGHPREFVR